MSRNKYQHIYDEVKPLPTEYNGVLFRSRTEARWAVYFDALGIEWHYEPQHFRLSDGGFYKPDFYLPRMGFVADGGGSVGMYVEVKPRNAPDGMFDKARAFAETMSQTVLLLDGGPRASRFKIYVGRMDMEFERFNDGLLAAFHPKYLPGGVNADEYRLWSDYDGNWDASEVKEYFGPMLAKALEAVNCAEFSEAA